MDNTVEFIHQVVAYPLAFILAPLALLTFAGARGHKRLGHWYLYVMTFLYVTGTFLTLTRHPWGSWGFGRNVAFNFFGYSLILFGARAMVLFRAEDPRPTRLDRVLAGILGLTAAGLCALAWAPDATVRVFAVLAVALAVLELRELRAGFQPRDVLYRRHVRYVLGSYFYVLTVASIVHLGTELPRDVKWLWPSALGLVVVLLVSSRLSAALPLRRAHLMRAGVGITVAVGLCFGGYALWEVWRDLSNRHHRKELRGQRMGSRHLAPLTRTGTR